MIWESLVRSRVQVCHRLARFERSEPSGPTCFVVGVTSALPASWVGKERGRCRGVGHRNSHSMDEMKQRKLLLRACILLSSSRPRKPEISMLRLSGKTRRSCRGGRGGKGRRGREGRAKVSAEVGVGGSPWRPAASRIDPRPRSARPSIRAPTVHASNKPTE
ncbi:hypothetical protein EVAR_8079_1 [Eumeta japonica]|uniref:Uncharacterized protein n=1 Tax=Eumeta variegata TaxID=151549 RepID=A0A4C1TSN1_EUMVA|nr:hypothetical protein EVAR_8079_1 [Eumeta japonica]